MTSTRTRFFSLHKLLTLSAFLLAFLFLHENVLAIDLSGKLVVTARSFRDIQNTPGACYRRITGGPVTCNEGGREVVYSNCGLNATTCERSGTATNDRLIERGETGTPEQKIAAAEAEKEKDNSKGVCSYKFSLIGCLSWIADLIVGNIVWLINQVLSWILSIAMYLLDLVIYITVVKFTDNFANLNIVSTNWLPSSGPNSTLGGTLFGPERGGLIYYIWGMLRDFVNLLLLITIIYYAVKTMFEGFSGHRDKFLYLLVFSIVINFSLFFVKFAIDMSNILSLQAYTLMANPASFDDWKGFRQNAGGGSQVLGYQVIPNATLGDYLLNIASIGGVHKAGIGGAEAERRIHEGMKASWLYQVIVMLMYIGLIYIVFFLAGLLIMRAAAFLAAMLLAALLAADIFFSTFKQGDIEFANTIRGYTDKIRDDFYEALIKGPVLFLFLFLVGVLSNAIFNQSLQTEITSITNSSEEFKVFGSAFAASLAIFLKFAMFFALTKVLFDKLNGLKFSGQKEGKWLGGSSKAIGNFLMRQTVGRGAGALGWAGRNTIGRGLGTASRSTNTFLADRGRLVTDKINKLKDDKGAVAWTRRYGLQLQQMGLRQGQRIAGAVAGSSAVKGSYDGRAGIAAAAKRATGAELDLGDRFDKGYEEEDEKRKADRAAKEKKNTELTAGNLALTEAEEADAYDKSKVRFAGQVLSVSEMSNILKEANDEGQRKRIEDEFSETGSATIGGKKFTLEQENLIYNKTAPGSLDEIYNKQKSDAKKKAEDTKRKKFETARTTQIASGGADNIFDDTLNIANRVSGASKAMIEGAEETQLEGARKKAKETVYKLEKQINTIRGTFISNVSEIDGIVTLPAVGAEVPAPVSTGLTDELATIEKFKKELEYHLNPASRPEGYVVKTNEDFVEEFNTSVKDDFFKAKTKVLEEIRDQYNRVRLTSEATELERKALGQRKRAIESALERLERQKEAYEAITKPTATP